MKRRKKIVIAIMLLALASVSILLVIDKRNGAHDLPGKVIGPNPTHIPKDQLPECDFNGASFVQQPCYSPPGSAYL